MAYEQEGGSNPLIRRYVNDGNRVRGPEKRVCHRTRGGNGLLHSIFFLLMLIALPHSVSALLRPPQFDPSVLEPVPNSRAPNQTTPLLECLQVSPPVYSSARPTCQQTLMVHTFGWSYGKPFLSEYTPPSCDFNRVTLNFTVTSAGRQYDRLGLMFFNDTEIFRTSTAEPTQNGIIWTYIKDMSNYLALFKERQKIIFDLGNLVDDTYTGSWNTTLTATFFTAGDNIEAADVIIPVSTRASASDNPSGFVVPESRALNTLTLPQHIKKAVFTISACGQATEEFWWSNVLSSDTHVFGNETTLYGHSPFRELQLYIDDSLAGVAWPFPVIFTGGIVPGFWRPVVGIDAFDLREDEIDITPFVPTLSDGKEHSFEIRVAGIDDDGGGNGSLTTAVGSNWVVTGKVFLWLHQDGSITTGTAPTIDAPEPSLELYSSSHKEENGTVHTLKYSVNVARSLSINSTIQTPSGPKVVTWQQNLKYINEGEFTNSGTDQISKQSTSGSDISSNGYSKTFDYPLYVFSSYKVLPGGNLTIDGKMARGKNVRRIGDLAFPSELKTLSQAPRYGSPYTGTSTSDLQNGTASYLGAPALKRSFGSGSTEQWYFLYGVDDSATFVQDATPGLAAQGITELYRHHILAANDTIILDEESLSGAGVQKIEGGHTPQSMDDQSFAELGIKETLGRGPF